MQSETQIISLALGQNLAPSSIISHPNSEEKKFFITLNSMNKPGNNQLSIVEYNKSQEGLTQNTLPFQQYIKDIQFTTNHSLILHSLNHQNKSHLSILKEESIQSGKGQFVSIEHPFEQQLKSVVHNKNGVLIQSERELYSFDIQKKTKSQVFQFNQPIDFAAVDIIHDNLILCASNRTKQIQVIDQQTKGEKYVIENMNTSDILGVHFNPIKQYHFMSVFEDCFKIWDMRKSNLPIKCVDNHQGLLLNGKYNCTYDQLILTSYDDGTLGLYRISSGTSMINKMTTKDEEGLVKLYDDHDDSVYHISWASFTPWIFASVSYNGNLYINQIPSALKVRILY